MFINKTDNTSFNFKAPLGKTANSVNEVLFPAPEAISEPDLSESVEIKQMVTTIDCGEMDGNKTLNLTLNSQLTAGALLHVKAKSDATARSLTPGTGMTGPAMAGTINKTKAQSFIYDGSTFVAMGAVIQLD